MVKLPSRFLVGLARVDLEERSRFLSLAIFPRRMIVSTDSCLFHLSFVRKSREAHPVVFLLSKPSEGRNRKYLLCWVHEGYATPLKNIYARSLPPLGSMFFSLICVVFVVAWFGRSAPFSFATQQYYMIQSLMKYANSAAPRALFRIVVGIAFTLQIYV